MARYRVYFRTVASTSVVVDANDEDEAIEAAYDQTPCLCASCSGFGRPSGVELGEWETEDQPWPSIAASVAVELVD